MIGGARNAALDGLRGLAVLLIIAFHLSVTLWEAPGLPARVHAVLDAAHGLWDLGQTGVALFFTLSGYLLFRPFVAAAGGRGAPVSIRHFALRRAARVLPAYAVSLAVLAIALRPPAGQLAAHALLVHNADEGWFHGIQAPYWSLAVEADYYVLLAIAGAALAAMLARRPAALAAFAAAAALLPPLAGLAGPRLLGGHAPLLATALYGSSFGGGMLVACVERSVPAATARRAAWAGAAFALLYAAFALGVGRRFGHLPLALNCYAMSFAFAAGLLGVVAGGAAASLLGWAPLRWTGLVSYSLCLWNQPLIERSVAWSEGLGASWARALAVAAGLALLGLAAHLGWRFVELPFLRASNTRSP